MVLVDIAVLVESTRVLQVLPDAASEESLASVARDSSVVLADGLVTTDNAEIGPGIGDGWGSHRGCGELLGQGLGRSGRHAAWRHRQLHHSDTRMDENFD